MIIEGIKWARVAKILGVAAGALAVVGANFIWSGVYNVAASTDHLSVTTWLLERVREQSIATQSLGIDAPALDDDGMIRLGASHYEGGCAPCHNRPGSEINPIVSGMLPSPPDLEEALEERRPESVYWIVQHGLKYTGMPAWPSQVRGDEVWAVTAFLDTLGDLPAGAYPDLAGLRRVQAIETDAGLGNSSAFQECARCHENADLSTNGDRIPRLSGQPIEYLTRSLREYAQRRRPSGVMQPIAALLDEEEVRNFATYYSKLSVEPQQLDKEDEARFERGRLIAEQGVPEDDIPACNSCHSATSSRNFPRLAGQHAEYISVQLHLWQRGGRTGTTFGRIMAPIAQRLSSDQIADVAHYYQAISPETPATASSTEAVR
nr:cytochrome c [Rhizobium sp. Q54]